MNRPSPFADKFKKPKKVVLAQENPMTLAPLSPDGGLPLVIKPAIEDLDHLGWLRDHQELLTEKLHRYGALLFRGFTITSPEDFEEIATAVCGDLYGEYGDLPHESGNVYGATPYPPDAVIYFHNESSHMHRWPMRQFFYCHLPAPQGGSTPIVDCRELYRALGEDIAVFESKGLRYIRNFIPGIDVSWQDFFKTDDPAQVEAYCSRHKIHWEWKGEGLNTYQLSPAVARHPYTGEAVFFNQIQLHHSSCLDPELRKALMKMFSSEEMPRNVCFGDGSPIPDQLVSRTMDLCWRHCVEFEWQRGDVLMVDNMLVAHARKSYVPPRKIYVAMGDIHSARP